MQLQLRWDSWSFSAWQVHLTIISDLDLIATTAMATRVEAPSHHWASFSVVSFNFGMQQTMLTPGKKASRHQDTLAQLFNVFGNEIKAHFIFGCEMGGHQQGFAHAGVDLGQIVRSVLPHAECHTQGAYASVWNTSGQRATCIQSDIFRILDRDVDMVWNIFEVDCLGAFQRGENAFI